AAQRATSPAQRHEARLLASDASHAVRAEAGYTEQDLRDRLTALRTHGADWLKASLRGPDVADAVFGLALRTMDLLVHGYVLDGGAEAFRTEVRTTIGQALFSIVLPLLATYKVGANRPGGLSRNEVTARIDGLEALVLTVYEPFLAVDIVTPQDARIFDATVAGTYSALAQGRR